MAKQHRSAGIVVYREGSAGGGQREYLLLDYGRFWDYPKGHVEKGEDDLSAAVRELAEETGIKDVRVEEGFEHELSYFFRDKREGLIHKTVVFFLGETSAKEIKLSWEHKGGEFLPFDQAMERLTYDNAKQALRKAGEFLKRKG